MKRSRQRLFLFLSLRILIVWFSHVANKRYSFSSAVAHPWNSLSFPRIFLLWKPTLFGSASVVLLAWDSIWGRDEHSSKWLLSYNLIARFQLEVCRPVIILFRVLLNKSSRCACSDSFYSLYSSDLQMRPAGPSCPSSQTEKEEKYRNTCNHFHPLNVTYSITELFFFNLPDLSYYSDLGFMTHVNL